jgi:hypothetical protein
MPANNSPSTTGCFIRWKISANIFAENRRIESEIII